MRSPSFLRCLISLVTSFAVMDCQAAGGPLEQLIKTRDFETFQSAIEASGSVNLTDELGVTPLMCATRHFSTKEMNWLMDRGANPNARSKEKFTAFNFAVTDRSKAELLLDRGFDFKVCDETNSSALMIAARHPRGWDVASLLISRGADVNARGPGGATALQRAVKSGELRMVKLLVESGAKVNDSANKGLFFSAVLTGNEKIAQFLIEQGADLNLSDGFAGHSLSAALVNGNATLVSDLIERGAEIHQTRNVGEVPPILFAAHNEQGDPTMVKLLLAKGADINARNDRDETALSWAKKRGETELVRFLKANGAQDPASPRQRLATPENDVHLNSENSKSIIRASVSKALSILEKGSKGFMDREGRPDNCVSCHHQTLPGIAFGWAAQRDYAITTALIEREISVQKRYWRKGLSRAWEYDDPIGGGAANVSYGMLNLAANGYQPDQFTEAMSFYLVGTQLADGGWASFDGRPPSESTRIATSAFALRSTQSFPPEEAQSKTEERETLAREFFRKQTAETSEERSFKLLGLLWSKASNDDIHFAARGLLEAQRQDGGWSQIPTLESDAYATGQTLLALILSGQLAPDDSRYIQGAEFLLRTQFPDGSWLVKSRSWPFQTHFNTGFPHGRDQWISASATAWASMALMVTLDPDGPPGLQARVLGAP